MAKTNSINIGKVISFNATHYERRLNAYEKILIPIIEQVLGEYKKLGLGEPDQQAYLDLYDNGIKNVAAKYKQLLEGQAEGFPAPIQKAALQDWEKALQPLQNILGTLRQNVIQLYRHTLGDLNTIDMRSTLIVNGTAVTVDKETLKRQYQVIIETENQSEIYEDLLTLQTVLTDLFNKLADKGYNGPITGHDGLISFDEGEVRINAEAIVHNF